MFVPLKLLKVLAFDTSISLQRVPMQLGDLVFLRYLSITQWFQDLDDIVSNNPNLETLVVSGNGAPTVHLPSSIWKSPRLRHLELGNSYFVDPPSADKKNLQTLCWVVRPLHCRKKVFSKFPNINNLKIFLKDDIEPNHIGGCCSNPIILDHFDYFKWLERLSISISFGCNVALPELAWFPSRLKKLKLSGTNISEGDLNVIAKLPNLMVLKLENAFHGIVWEVAQKGFCELRFLLIEAKELKQWVVSSSVDFINLRHLVLRSCNCLEQMPKDFIGYRLESIELEGCHSSLVASAKQLQQKRISMGFFSLNGNVEIPRGLARIYTLKSIELEGCGSPLVASAKQFQWDTGNSFVEAKGPTLHLPSRIWEPPHFCWLCCNPSKTVYVSFKTEEVEVDGTNLYSCDLTVISMLAQLEVLIMGKYGK
nr:putative late blight resistance protein homolog R1A-4 isoform X1 [Ipomoea batatas]